MCPNVSGLHASHNILPLRFFYFGLVFFPPFPQSHFFQTHSLAADHPLPLSSCILFSVRRALIFQLPLLMRQQTRTRRGEVGRDPEGMVETWGVDGGWAGGGKEI